MIAGFRLEKTLTDALRQIQDDDVKRRSIYFTWSLLLAFALVKCLVFTLRVFSQPRLRKRSVPPRGVLVGRMPGEPRRTVLQTYVRVPDRGGPEAIHDHRHSRSSRDAGRTMLR